MAEDTGFSLTLSETQKSGYYMVVFTVNALLQIVGNTMCRAMDMRGLLEDLRLLIK